MSLKQTIWLSITRVLFIDEDLGAGTADSHEVRAFKVLVKNIGVHESKSLWGMIATVWTEIYPYRIAHSQNSSPCAPFFFSFFSAFLKVTSAPRGGISILLPCNNSSMVRICSLGKGPR